MCLVSQALLLASLSPLLLKQATGERLFLDLGKVSWVPLLAHTTLGSDSSVSFRLLTVLWILQIAVSWAETGERGVLSFLYQLGPCPYTSGTCTPLPKCFVFMNGLEIFCDNNFISNLQRSNVLELFSWLLIFIFLASYQRWLSHSKAIEPK